MLRADATRNRNQLLEVATRVFASADTEPSMRAIAREAGVGIATLYRHFPTRESLVDAIYRDQVARLAKLSVDLLDLSRLEAGSLELRPEQLEPILPLAAARDEWQKRYINEVLERNNQNRTKTAKDLGVDPRTIFRHLERMEAEQRGEILPPDEGDP